MTDPGTTDPGRRGDKIGEPGELLERVPTKRRRRR